MNVCSNKDELTKFLRLAANVSEDHPVVVSKFIEHAKEIEMDAVARDGEILAYAISEHIEFAGVHSGDATIQFPPQKLYVETVRRALMAELTEQVRHNPELLKQLEEASLTAAEKVVEASET